MLYRGKSITFVTMHIIMTGLLDSVSSCRCLLNWRVILFPVNIFRLTQVIWEKMARAQLGKGGTGWGGRGCWEGILGRKINYGRYWEGEQIERIELEAKVKSRRYSTVYEFKVIILVKCCVCLHKTLEIERTLLSPANQKSWKRVS